MCGAPACRDRPGSAGKQTLLRGSRSCSGGNDSGCTRGSVLRPGVAGLGLAGRRRVLPRAQPHPPPFALSVQRPGAGESQAAAAGGGPPGQRPAAGGEEEARDARGAGPQAAEAGPAADQGTAAGGRAGQAVVTGQAGPARVSSTQPSPTSATCVLSPAPTSARISPTLSAHALRASSSRLAQAERPGPAGCGGVLIGRRALTGCQKLSNLVSRGLSLPLDSSVGPSASWVLGGSPLPLPSTLGFGARIRCVQRAGPTRPCLFFA